MPTIEMEWKNDTVTQNVARNDWRSSQAYRLHILLTKDDADSFSAVVLNLPGTGSSGSTEEEALENAKPQACGARMASSERLKKF